MRRLILSVLAIALAAIVPACGSGPGPDSEPVPDGAETVAGGRPLARLASDWILLEQPRSGDMLGQGYNPKGGLTAGCYVAMSRIDSAETKIAYSWALGAGDSLGLGVAKAFGVQYRAGRKANGRIQLDTALLQTAMNLAPEQDCPETIDGLPKYPVVVMSYGYSGYSFEARDSSGRNITASFLKIFGTPNGGTARVRTDSSIVEVKGRRWVAIRLRGFAFGPPTAAPEVTCGIAYSKDRGFPGPLYLNVTRIAGDSVRIEHWSRLTRPVNPFKIVTLDERWFLVGADNLSSSGRIYRAQIHSDRSPGTYCARIQQLNVEEHEFRTAADSARLRTFIGRSPRLHDVTHVGTR